MPYRSDGEQLFYAIRDEALDAMPSTKEAWQEVGDALSEIGGTHLFGSYVRGAVAIHAVRRLIRYWRAEAASGAENHLEVKHVSRFISGNMFPGLERQMTTKLARLTIACGLASGRPVTPSLRKNVLREEKELTCYLCAQGLDAGAAAGHEQHATVEHVWPSSIGGDSVEDNLMPACEKCQQRKRDAFSWEWYNIHNLVLPPSPSGAALESVSQAARIARHYLHAITESEERRISLKGAFKSIGAMAPTAYADPGYDMPVTFFDLKTVEE